MIKHIVMWTIRPVDAGSVTDTAHEMKTRLEALNGLLPGLLRLEVGVDFGRTPASADVVLYSEFTDRESLDAYQVHPDHVAVGEFCNSVRAQRMVADYEA